MIRAGFTDSALDEEARQLVAAAEALRSIDAAVESVLLVSAQVILLVVEPHQRHLTTVQYSHV